MRAALSRRAKRLLDVAWDRVPPTYRNRILYYHSVHPQASRSTRPASFRAQIEWLGQEGYRFVRMREVPALLADSDSPPWVALTFDDGYRDNLEHALPILDDYRVPATFYVVAGMVGPVPYSSADGHMLYPARPMLTEADVAALAAAGMEIGSHTDSHRLATDLLRLGRLREELETSGRKLAELAGESIVSFSYPNGQRGAFSRETRRVLEGSRYQSAVTTVWGAVPAGADPLALPRCEVGYDDDLREFAAKMTGRREYRWVLHRVRRGSRLWTPLQ